MISDWNSKLSSTLCFGRLSHNILYPHSIFLGLQDRGRDRDLPYISPLLKTSSMLNAYTTWTLRRASTTYHGPLGYIPKKEVRSVSWSAHSTPGSSLNGSSIGLRSSTPGSQECVWASHRWWRTQPRFVPQTILCIAISIHSRMTPELPCPP